MFQPAKKPDGKIKAMLVERGISFAEVGRSVTPPVGGQIVSDVAKGRRHSARIKKAIARYLRVRVRELFPDYQPPRRKTVA